MSGYKRATVSISQDEYDRLRESETKLRSIPEPNHETHKKIQETSHQILNQTLEDFQEREERYQRILDGLDGYVQAIEQPTNQSLNEFQENTLAQVNAHVGHLSNNYEDILLSQADFFDKHLIEINRQSQRQLSAYLNLIDQFEEDHTRKKMIAETWERMSLDLNFFIQQEFPLAFFLPGISDQIETRISQAAENIHIEFFETAVAQYQAIYNDLSELRLRLEKMTQEWRILFQAAYEAVNDINAIIENSKLVQAIDLEGNELPFLIDVNLWTNGGLVNIQNQLIQIGEVLFDQNRPPACDYFYHILQDELPKIFDDLNLLVLNARVKSINSQLRINIADLVINALSEQGFHLEDSFYESEDMRLGYDACLKNYEGNEVIVRVAPSGDAVGENELHIESLDSELKTEHELTRRWTEINTSLQSVGLEIGPFTKIDPSAKVRQPKKIIPQINERKFSGYPSR